MFTIKEGPQRLGMTVHTTVLEFLGDFFPIYLYNNSIDFFWEVCTLKSPSYPKVPFGQPSYFPLGKFSRYLEDL